jgi:hypothetical protein
MAKNVIQDDSKKVILRILVVVLLSIKENFKDLSIIKLTLKKQFLG